MTAGARASVTPAPFRVADRRRETHDTWTLRLLPAAGSRPLHCLPGQFAMVYAFGAGEVPISVSEACDGGDGVVHTVRAVGAATRAICAAGRGDVLGLRGPFGAPWPLDRAEGRDVLVVAGGLGLAPLRPVVQEVLRHPARYGRVTVLYGGRRPSELLYRAELDRWGRAGGVAVEVTVDTAPPGWTGPVGVVPRLLDRARFTPARTVAFVCGPEVMMRFTLAALEERGVPAGSAWLSLERSMKCATGHCGHCQLRELFVCKDGPVLRADVVEPIMRVPEL